jgi:thioredoxin 1
MANLVELTDANFDDVVLKADKPVLVDFSAAWCGPCQRLNPIIHEIADEYSDKALVCHLDVDSAQEASRKFRIMTVPTCIFFKGGEPKETISGLVPKELLTGKIDDLL